MTATNDHPRSLYRADSVVTSFGVSAVASALSRIIGLIRNVALAWLIPQAQFGLFGVAVLVINILLPICSLGIYEGMMRYAPYHEAKGTLRRFVIRAGILLLALLVVSSILLWAFALPVSELFFSATQELTAAPNTAEVNDSVPLLRAIVLCVFGLAVLHSLAGFFKGLHMFRAFGAAEVVSAAIFTSLAVGAAWTGYGSAFALVTAYAVACGLSILLFAPRWFVQLTRTDPISGVHRNVPSHAADDDPTDNRTARAGESLGYLINYSFWAAVTAVSWHAMSYYPMWYLLKMSDSETVGSFHAVRLIAQVIQLGAVILTGVVAANVTRIWEHVGRAPAIERLTFLTKAVLLVMLAAACVLLLARPLVLRLFPTSFADGGLAYQPMLLSYLLVGVVGLLAVRLTVLEKPRLICLAWGVGTVVTIAVSTMIIRPATGAGSVGHLSAIAAAAWASVAGVSSAVFMCLVLVRREGIGLKWRGMLILASCFLVGCGPQYALPVAAVLIVLSLTTSTILSKAERTLIKSGLTSDTLAATKPD